MISLQFITHRTERYSYFESARMALEGGCKWIQLRMKDAPLDEVEAVALQLKPLCKEHEAILILDDHVELAKKLEVDGVHLGKKDMPIDQARQILGEAFIIGGTANTFEDVLLHYRAGADYLGIGPFRFTTTKQNLSPVLGRLEEELGSVDALLAEGRISEITKWLNEKIHQYGSTRSPKEVIRYVCGKEVSAEPLIRYFKEKYTKVYNLG